MLIRLIKYPPFQGARLERLRVLESILRRSAVGKLSVHDYTEVLETAETALPTRRSLELDFEAYAQYCDDVLYGRDADGKPLAWGGLQLNPDATRDAVRWFLGEAWLESPLRPRISSSVARCLLLAKDEGGEVQIEYRRIPLAGEPWQPRRLQGVPRRVLPGADSAYMQLWSTDGTVRNLNLARLTRVVEFTGKYPDMPSLEDEIVRYRLRVPSADTRQRLLIQFAGLVSLGGEDLQLSVPQSLATMTIDILVAHIQRTHDRPGEKDQLKLPAGILIEKEEKPYVRD